jgi:hypothetical protein
VVRHLREPYNDPMTGEELELITDPAQRIIGVRSSSDLEPFQQDGFPEELDKLKGKSSYREWEFVFVPAKAKSTTSDKMSKPTTGDTFSMPMPRSITQ